MSRSVVRAVTVVLVGCSIAVAEVKAQLVTPRTVPVFQNGQFGFLPSATESMAGVTIAIDDSIADAFINPAKGTRLRGGMLFLAPFSHGISGDRGGGRTFPVGGAASVGNWSFGGLYATQDLRRAGPMRFSNVNSEQMASNQYLSLSLARRLPLGVSLGVSGSWAALGAVDGVDLLYAGSSRITQSGSYADVRLGLTKEFSGDRKLEFVVLNNISEMTHDVLWRTQRFDSVSRSWSTTERTEVNDDRTHIWGAHAEYTMPIGKEGWKLGWLATVNQLSHPKIPTFVLVAQQSIPRDPGGTLSANAGIGLSKTANGSTFGIDFVVEPMKSNTWADAAADTAIVGGGTIKKGGKTIENDFRFSNSLLRAGFAHDFVTSKTDSASLFGIQLGLAVYNIKYTLGQKNNVAKTFREQREAWAEWTPTLGFSYKTRSIALHYNYTKTCVASECVNIGWGDKVEIVSPQSGGDVFSGTVITAPLSPLTFSGGTATSHKFWMAIPIR
jgi:hypothetical protein